MEFKLINGTVPGSGRVVYELEGDPGAFCMLNTPSDIHDPLAIVTCRELGYVDGVLLLEKDYRTSEHIVYRLPIYPDGRRVKNYLRSVKCVGNESKFRDCTYELLNTTDIAWPTCANAGSDYRACLYRRMYDSVQYRCSNKDLSVRCLTKGDSVNTTTYSSISSQHNVFRKLAAYHV